eukprot:COSAG04_NODE_9656_length_843_cov_1.307796_2_plen_33_part_01
MPGVPASGATAPLPGDVWRFKIQLIGVEMLALA